jgi:hypothetical protein
LTCLSSSGKYFICFGRLWGHCCDKVAVGAAQRIRRMLEGKESRVEICILERAARCRLVASSRRRARNVELCCARYSRFYYTFVRWLVESRMRESCKSRGWDGDALAPHRRYGFKVHPHSSE